MLGSVAMMTSVTASSATRCDRAPEAVSRNVRDYIGFLLSGKAGSDKAYARAASRDAEADAIYRKDSAAALEREMLFEAAHLENRNLAHVASRSASQHET